jgi:hypothetical protein
MIILYWKYALVSEKVRDSNIRDRSARREGKSEKGHHIKKEEDNWRREVEYIRQYCVIQRPRMVRVIERTPFSKLVLASEHPRQSVAVGRQVVVHSSLMQIESMNNLPN